MRAFTAITTRSAKLTASRRRADSIRVSAHCDLSRGTALKGIELAAVAVLLGTSVGPAQSSEKVGEFAASGFIFKDTVEVMAFDDPDVKNVTIYLSDMQRSITDKLAKDFFNEPSQASLACVPTGVPQVLDESSIEGLEGKELLAQGRNLNLFQQKTLRVRRIWDAKRRNVIYIAYSTRLNSASDDKGPSTGRYKTSICAVSVPPPPA